jgi:phosphate-selective porin OprO and OprP
MKKTSTFSPTRVSMAVAVVCVGISMPAFAQVAAKVTGRVQFDARNHTNSTATVDDRDSANYADNYEIRRARIGVSGTINKDIAYEVVGNAVGSSTNFVDTAFANYGFNKAAQFRAGRFKQPFSLEELTSSNSIDFMERSYGSQFSPGKKLGIMFHGVPTKGVTYAISSFQQDFEQKVSSQNLGQSNAARLAVNLAEMQGIEDSVIHLGYGTAKIFKKLNNKTSSSGGTTTTATVLSMRSENRGINNAYRIRLNGDSLSSTGYSAVGQTLTSVDSALTGTELAVARGPFKFQMENFNNTVNATSVGGSANLKVAANYYEVMYNITGESWSKAYKGGAFSGITPGSIFMKDYGGVVGNGIGAWQVGYRISDYKVTEGTVTSSSTGSPTGKTSTLALNWLLNKNARVMLNYSETDFGTSFTPVDTSGTTIDSERTISLRTQVNF